jgi:hypothetical protein
LREDIATWTSWMIWRNWICFLKPSLSLSISPYLFTSPTSIFILSPRHFKIGNPSRKTWFIVKHEKFEMGSRNTVID